MCNSVPQVCQIYCPEMRLHLVFGILSKVYKFFSFWLLLSSALHYLNLIVQKSDLKTEYRKGGQLIKIYFPSLTYLGVHTSLIPSTSQATCVPTHLTANIL